jgi:hypothetical protein
VLPGSSSVGASGVVVLESTASRTRWKRGPECVWRRAEGRMLRRTVHVPFLGAVYVL